MVQIITDSSSDLPEELIKEYDIRVVPLTITIDDHEYAEGVDIKPLEFYREMAKASSLPKTSQPSPASFVQAFNDLAHKGELLCLTISSKLSGTYQSACLGKELTDLKVSIFDTLGGSLGHGLQILRAAELAKQGLSLNEILEKLAIYRDEMNILVLLDTLENIVKGGRLSKFQGSLAKLLDLKILLQGVEGSVEMLEKIRGKKKFYQRVLDIIGERREDFSDRIFGITHVDNMEDAEYLRKEIIARYNPQGVIINYMGATMGTYAGQGGIIISF